MGEINCTFGRGRGGGLYSIVKVKIEEGIIDKKEIQGVLNRKYLGGGEGRDQMQTYEENVQHWQGRGCVSHSGKRGDELVG